jgi:hypothetical protein
MKFSVRNILLALVVIALIVGWVVDHLRQASLLDGATKRMENMKRQFEAGKRAKMP